MFVLIEPTNQLALLVEYPSSLKLILGRKCRYPYNNPISKSPFTLGVKIEAEKPTSKPVVNKVKKSSYTMVYQSNKTNNTCKN
jgi:hypothetical protein